MQSSSLELLSRSLSYENNDTTYFILSFGSDSLGVMIQTLKPKLEFFNHLARSSTSTHHGFLMPRIHDYSRNFVKNGSKKHGIL